MPGSAKVEKHERNIGLVVEDVGRLGGSHRTADLDVVAQLRQQLRERLLNQRVIVDNEDLHGASVASATRAARR